jgi:hypothetical protein
MNAFLRWLWPLSVLLLSGTGGLVSAQGLLPYAQAVADRFPPPAERPDTPGLQPGRQTWTDNTELDQALRAIAGRGAARLLEVGASGNGHPLLALQFSRGPGRPVALLIGQQHGNEPAGGEALLAVARQLADPRHPVAAVLDRLDVVVLPRANPDGAMLNRRVNAAGLDINRDHLLLRTPEAEALAGLQRSLQPVLVIDAHEHIALGRYMPKFGGIKGHDLLIQYATTPNLPPALSQAAETAFRQPLLQALDRAGLSHEWYYTNPTDPTDRLLTMGGIQPDLARNASGLKNAVSFLLESRGFDLHRLHAERRVHSHIVAIHSLLASAAAQADTLLALQAQVAAEVAGQACQGLFTVEGRPTREQRDIRLLDPDTGADKTLRVDWDSALKIEPLRTRARPCGYWLAPTATAAVTRLHQLGVLVRTLPAEQALRVERYRETARGEGARLDTLGRVRDPYTVLQVSVALEPGLLQAPAGSFYVPLDQPLAPLVVAALEPDTPSSWFAHRLLPGLEAVQRVMARP